MPYLVTGAIDVELARTAANLRKVGDIEEDPDSGYTIGEHHPPHHLSSIETCRQDERIFATLCFSD